MSETANTTEPKKNTKNINVVVSADLRRRIGIHIAERDMTLKDFVTQALEEKLAAEGED